MTARGNALGTLLAALLSAGAAAGRVPEAHGAGLDAATIGTVVESLANSVAADYFDAAMGAKAASELRAGLAQGRYAQAPDLEALATLVTRDLYAVAKDRHLSMVVAQPPSPAPAPVRALAEETREERGKRENFGFQKTEILAGNVGYLRVTAFYRPEETREAMAAAMAFLSQADALIVDLRDHGGGATPTVALFTSYFLDQPEMPLFAITPRPPAEPRRYLTEPGTLAHRNGSRPIFVLTSAQTSSGGEAVAFLLQERHRAVVIGEGTWGGANQVPNPRPLGHDFKAYIPNGRMGSTLTGGNWEGVGVIPDVPAGTDQALRVAQAMALQAVLRSVPQGLWQDKLKAELATVALPTGAEPPRH